MALDGITIRNLSKELDFSLAGGQIQKIYQPDSQNLYFVIRKNGIEYPLVYSESMPFSHLRICQGETPLNPETPSSFCMLLRKYLIGGRIGEIKQIDWDRIIEITVDYQNGSKISSTRIIVELTGRLTNFIVVNHEGMILDALHRIPAHKNLYRTILPNQKYHSPPPQEKCPPDDFEVNRMANSFFQLNGSQSIAKALQDRFNGFGPDFIAEILFQAQIAKNAIVNELSHESLENILSILQKKITQLLTLPAPYYYLSLLGNSSKVSPIQYDHFSDYSIISTQTISEAIEKLSEASSKSFGPKKMWLDLIDKELKRLFSRQKALLTDGENWLNSPSYQLWGDLLMIYLNQVPRWLSEVSLENLFDENDPTTLLTIPLNSNKSALENANTFYHMQQKANRAQNNIDLQLEKLNEDLSYYESLSHHLENSTTSEELENVRQELLQINLIRSKIKGKNSTTLSNQFSTYTSPNGFQIWVGKNNLQNDQLTMKKAQSTDYWFHTQKIPGSHVIMSVPPTISEEELGEDLLFAAQLAAFFSKARNSNQVPVDYVQKKHIWKPNGAKPGFVLYESQKTLMVLPKEPDKSAHSV
jgi:predicted ribosome quality control (RQC) complex YloA/Tae2 family protein